MPDKILSQEEINALLSSTKRLTQEELRKRNARVYDFKNPERFPKEGLRRVRALHESFARSFALSIAGYTRSVIEVSISSIDQLTYQEFLLSVPMATCFNVLELPPLKGKMALEINPSVLISIIDRLLGGSGKAIDVKNRELTEIEWVVARRIINKITTELKNVWSSVISFNIKIVDQESNPYFAQVLAPNELVLLVCFDVSVGDTKGILSLCYPINLLEPVIPMLLSRQSSKGAKGEVVEKWRRGLLSASAPVRAVLDKMKMPVKEIVSLNKGDVVLLNKKVNTVVDVYLRDKKILKGQWAQSNGRKVIRVV